MQLNIIFNEINLRGDCDLASVRPDVPIRLRGSTCQRSQPMIVRSIEDVAATDLDVAWGNGQSRRLIVKRDGMGFAIAETLVLAGTESLLEYKNHLEACYCITGEGEVEDMAGNRHAI